MSNAIQARIHGYRSKKGAFLSYRQGRQIGTWCIVRQWEDRRTWPRLMAQIEVTVNGKVYTGRSCESVGFFTGKAKVEAAR